MGLSVVSRPTGYKVDSTSYAGSYTLAGNSITSALHGLSTADTIYISSGYLIGFWYVNVTDVNHFEIREYATATSVVFIGTGSFTFYRAVYSHKVSAVFLPIVYKLQSTLWPVNSVDTSRTVSSFANDNGYTKITASGTLKSDITELEFVKITGGPNAGIYQVISWYSSSIVTINLIYNSGYSFGGATIQYYYKDYQARIRVYAGITSSHPFGGVRPYELLCEQGVTPDSAGLIIFNVNEYLKAKIEALKNDLNAPALPNNLDAWCNFYIEYAEAYTYSAGGYGLLDYVSSYTSDAGTFEGIATNSDLPFKNTYSGFMSDYLYGNGHLLKFLTPSLYPVHFNNYFDISWLNQFDQNIRLRRELYKNGSIIDVQYDSISDYGIGLYRKKISLSGNEDRIDAAIVYNSTQSIDFSNATTWGTGTINWLSLSPATASLLILTSGTVKTVNLAVPYTSFPGVTYLINYSITLSAKSGNAFSMTFLVNATNGKNLPIYGTDSVLKNADGTYTGTLTFTPSSICTYLSIEFDLFSTPSGGSWTGVVNSLTISANVSNVDLSETKTLTIDTSCTSNYIDLSWLNYLGGFDYWRFKGFADYGADIENTSQSDKNIIPNYPKSIGANADTLRFETKRESRNKVLCRAENLTADQVQDLYRIKLSPLVQIVNSETDRKTIILDSDSFFHYPQGNKLFEFSFTFSMTDANPVQEQ